ncbi:uncharacterized protein A4U43_C04F25740 [Asparagus officinalis]|uniref:Uncharacterized protein n=1 Tax=Asparagus officinalis TaxID=4686 RepID=A0A5P1F3M0_ASPOF|nr:anthranilate N-benzoyltransferase protein 1-like [Asparagus officinalis]ONK72986.1 uncharacterized protein A4U43_C04F25740 [Asparagus officinalis]
MASERCHETSVVIRHRERIKATGTSLQEHRMPLSNLDFLLPPVDVGVFFVYRNREHQLRSSSKFDTLKTSLSEALATYYPLAGVITENLRGEPELLCNNSGVDFLEAYFERGIAELDLYNPEECLEGKLVPRKDEGVFCIQATELKCGGLVIACVFDHRIADAYSINMFLLGWSQLACSKPISIIPCFYCFPHQLHYASLCNSSITNLYVPASSLSLSNNCSLTSRIYHVSLEHINRLQILSKATTKLQAFSAFLWQTIAKGMKCNPENFCKMAIVVDGRSRLNHDMSTYFGNLLGVVFRKHTAKDLSSMKLSEVVGIVEEMIKEGTKEEHFLELDNMIGKQSIKGVRSRIYSEEESDGAAFIVSSGRKFPMSEVDFGWGQPNFGSYHFGWGGKVGHIMPIPSTSCEEEWVVCARLMEWQVVALETYGEGIFRSLTSGHLMLFSDSAEE